jgi:tetratricopeptide (TPR) repeat protein
MARRCHVCLALLGIIAGSVGSTHAQGDKKGAYASAQEAYNIAVTYLNSKNLPKAQEALEASLKLSPDAKLKGKILRALLIPYDKDADYTKFLGVIEEVIANPTSPAEKSINRTDVLGFLQERKKEKDAVDRYEAKLKKDPKDVTSLYILSGIYGELLRDAKKSAELTERLAELTKDSSGKVDISTSIQLASQYVKSGKLKEGAELYEKIADQDEKKKTEHLKDAAVAWMKAGEKEKAVAAAKAASTGGYDEKNKLLAHFWNRRLGEVFLEAGEGELAVRHLEKAIELTNIAGYKKDCTKKLEEAKRLVKK